MDVCAMQAPVIKQLGQWLELALAAAFSCKAALFM